VEAGKDLGIVVAIQTDTANQELFVDLTHHRTWEGRSFSGHPNTLSKASHTSSARALRRG